MLAFPVADLKPVAKIMLVSAIRKTSTPTEEIERIVDFANLARKEGLLALETKLQTVEDPFFGKGIQLVIDGFGADTVRDIMELEADWEDSRHSTGRKIVDQLGAFAPAFGMIGTLVGLVQMLQDLSTRTALALAWRPRCSRRCTAPWAPTWSSSPWPASSRWSPRPTSSCASS